MPGVQTVNTVVLGLKGSGKTTWCQLYMRNWQRVLIADTLNEYDALQVTLDTLGNYDGSRFRLSVVPDDEADLVRLCSRAQTLGNLLLVIDEMGTWCESQDVQLALRQLVRTARHSGVSLCSIAHRASEVPRLVTGQADMFVLFHAHEPADLEHIRKSTGSPGLADVLRTLPRYHYAQYETQGGGLHIYPVRPLHVPQPAVPRHDAGLSAQTFLRYCQNDQGCGTM